MRNVNELSSEKEDRGAKNLYIFCYKILEHQTVWFYKVLVNYNRSRGWTLVGNRRSSGPRKIHPLL